MTREKKPVSQETTNGCMIVIAVAIIAVTAVIITYMVTR